MSSEDIVARLRAVGATGGIHSALSGNAADEIVRLRGEVERLTLERDYWARARNEWEKSARLLEEENKRLTRELEYITVQRDQWRDTCASHASRAEAAERERDRARKQAADMWKDCAERVSAAEAKVAKEGK